MLKKGDIVWIERWGGILGRVVSFNANTLNANASSIELEFPKSLKWRYGDIQPRRFAPVREEMINVLSADEVFEKMAEIFEQSLGELAGTIERTARGTFFSFKI